MTVGFRAPWRPSPGVIAAGAALGLAASLLYVPLLPAAVIPTLVVAGMVALVVHLCRDPADADLHRRMAAWTFGSLALHLVVSLAINTSDTTITYFGGDAFQYHQGAIDIVDHWRGGADFPLLPSGKEGFFYTLAALYAVLGPFTVAGLAMNAGFSAALVPLMTDTTRRLLGREAAARVPPFVVMLPGFVAWTSPLLREAGILFFMALVLNCAVRLMERFSLGALVGLALGAALLFSYRGNVAYMLLPGLVAGMALGRRRLSLGIGTGAAAYGVMAVLVFSVGIGYSGYRISAESDLERVNIVRTALSQSVASGVGEGADVSTPTQAVRFLPGALVQFLFGPFPWQVDNARQLLGLAEVAILWALVPSIWRGLRLGWRRAGRKVLVLVLPAIVLSIMLSLLIGNFGTITRERLQVLILLLPFLALGWEHRARRRRTPAQLSAAVAGATST